MVSREHTPRTPSGNRTPRTGMFFHLQFDLLVNFRRIQIIFDEFVFVLMIIFVISQMNTYLEAPRRRNGHERDPSPRTFSKHQHDFISSDIIN